MIPVRIDKDPNVRDDYSHLGRYVAAAKEKGEKLDKFWIAGCDAGTRLDDLDTALIEIEATRTMASAKVNDRTYHLVVSFHAGEREKLSQEDLQDIERNFAEALGFADHQRVAGTHVNTDNFHMHVAYNKVHPVTHKVHTPFRDFAALNKVARAMEQKYGLKVDKGMEARNPVSAKARNYEAKTWQQSFERHLQEHKAEIMAVIDGAADWRQVHEGLADFDTTLKKRGAGLAFVRIAGKGAMKASALDRECSLAALEKRLGPYVPAEERKAGEQTRSAPRRPYQARPLTRHPGTARLWRTYRQEKPSTFMRRHVFNLRSWRDYLLADAHKDPLALAIIVTYKEMFHSLEEALTPRRAPYRAPRTLRPALKAWYAASPWKPPSIAGLGKGDVDAMDLKTDDAGKLLFPFRDRAGHVWAVRALDAGGHSCDIGDPAGRPDLVHVIDPAGHLGTGKPYAGPILLTADCLSAAAIHLETETPVVVVGKEADLPTRARTLRAQYPDSVITIATPGKSRPAELAAGAVGGELVEISTRQALAKWVAKQADKGRPVAVDPALAWEMGAFLEDALSPQDAQDIPPKRPSQSPGRKAGDVGAFVEDALSLNDVLDAQPKQPGKFPGKGKASAVSPSPAGDVGAFVEDALSLEDAKASTTRKAPAPGKGKTPGKGGLGH